MSHNVMVKEQEALRDGLVLTASSQTLTVAQLKNAGVIVANRGTAITITLPVAANAMAGMRRVVVNKGAGALTLAVAAGFGGSGTTSVTLAQGMASMVYCNGSYWYVQHDSAVNTALASAKMFVGNAGGVATAVDLSGDVTVDNAGAVTIAEGAVEPSMLQEQALSLVDVPLDTWRKEDLLTPLPTAGDATNLGLVAAVHGTGSPTLQGAAASGNTKTETIRRLVAIPADYVAAGDVKIRLYAGVLVDPATTSATADVEAFEPNGAGGISADLCSTNATTINSKTMANKDFVITGTDLIAGDVLDVQVTTVVNDGGGTVGTKAIIGKIVLLYDRK